MYQYFVGIDISKSDFSVAVYGQKASSFFANTVKGFKEFYKAHSKLLNNGLVVLETTGGHEMALIHFLHKQGVAIHRADARKVKYFIQSLGTNAKTDAIDAHGLARYGLERHSSLKLFTPPSPAQHKLQQLMQRRIDLKKLIRSEKNRAQAPNLCKDVQNCCKALIKTLEKAVEKVDAQIDALFIVDETSAEKLKVLKEVTGIGDVVAKSLLIIMPELGQTDRRRIASLAGLAPHPHDSGKKLGYRRTKGGRSDIRPILFMAAMSAARTKSRLGEYYHSMVERGKNKMVALTALMRKILVIANAKLSEWYEAAEKNKQQICTGPSELDSRTL